MDGTFVPRQYLEAGVAQRQALLQGLMDTDGFVDDVAGWCEFTSVNEALANGVVEPGQPGLPASQIGRARRVASASNWPQVSGEVHP